jgi:hypothetical protein
VTGSATYRQVPGAAAGRTSVATPKDKAMNDDDVRLLDDTTLLLQRQAAADSGDVKRLAALDAELIRRMAVIRAALGGGR